MRWLWRRSSTIAERVGWETVREKEAERVRSAREMRGLVPSGSREPLDFEDFLVEVWRLAAARRADDARSLLASVWAWSADGARAERDVRVALRLFERFGVVSDDPDGWHGLPDELVVHRAETDDDARRGLCWTLDPEIAAMHADRHGISVSTGRVRKTDVLAYITCYGESEIVVHRENVIP